MQPVGSDGKGDAIGGKRRRKRDGLRRTVGQTPVRLLPILAAIFGAKDAKTGSEEQNGDAGGVGRNGHGVGRRLHQEVPRLAAIRRPPKALAQRGSKDGAIVSEVRRKGNTGNRSGQIGPFRGLPCTSAVAREVDSKATPKADGLIAGEIWRDGEGGHDASLPWKPQKMPDGLRLAWRGCWHEGKPPARNLHHHYIITV